MRIGSALRALAVLGTVSALGLAAGSLASVSAVPGGNLIQNPGAESVTTSGGRMKPTGWSTDPGFVTLSYGDAGPFVVGDYKSPDSPRGAPSSGGSGGSNYFSGPACRTAGCADNPYNNLGAAIDNTGSEARQSVSVASAASEIDTGGVKATLAALMGGYRGQTTVTAVFQDAGGVRLGTITIGPVATDGLSARSSTLAVPAKTRTIAVTLAERRADQTIPGYGFFDNISLTLSGASPPPTTTTAPRGADPIEGRWIFDRNEVLISKQGPSGHFVGTVTKPGTATCPYRAGQAIWDITRKGTNHYTGTHLSKHRDCSPDPGYPTVWDLIYANGKYSLRICVTAKDGYKACETLQRAGPSSRDVTRPRARALPGSGRVGTYVKLRFQASDNSGTTQEDITVYRGSTRLAHSRTSFGVSLAGHTYYIRWRPPSSAAGTLRFCVTSFDRAGNSSPTSCAALRIYR